MTKNKENQKKRHCMVVYAYYPLGETRVQREAEILIANGYEVDVICPRGSDEKVQENVRGVQVYRVPAKKKQRAFLKQFVIYLHFFVVAALKLTQLHLQRHYNSIQVHNLPDFLVFCAFVPKLDGVPVILDLHDLMPEFYAERSGTEKNSLLAQLIRWQESLACRFADFVITVSEHWRQTLIERGVPPHKCGVVMNVADEKIFHPPKNGDSQYSKDSRFRLIYHGSIVKRYGLDLAIQAVALTQQEIPNIQLVILGGGNYLPTLINLAQELDLENYVTFEQPRPAEELPAIILTADLGIVPYRNDVFTDGLLPTKLMEYAALGVPSIASRTTAIEAYFSDTMVEFFEPGDVDGLANCIRLLHNSPERLTDLSNRAKNFNHRYNWTKIGSEYVALVDQLNSKRKKLEGR